MNWLRIALVLACSLAVVGCSDDEATNNTVADTGVEDDSGANNEDDSGTTDDDMGTANNTTPNNENTGPCGADEWLNTVDMSCNACPGADFVCADFLPSAAVDPAANTFSLVFDPSAAEVTRAEYSGSRTEIEGTDTIVLPLVITGTVSEETITFDVSQEESADEIQLTSVRIVDGCGTNHDIDLTVRWEPAASVIIEPTCE